MIMTKSNFSEAVWCAVMHSGLGPVSPNTVLLGWPSDWRNRLKRDNDKAVNDESSIADSQALLSCSVNEFVDALKGLGNMQRAICVLKGTRFPRQGDIMPPRSTIDIYWVVDDGGLCLLLSYIISRNPIWLRDSRLRVFAVTTVDGYDHDELEKIVIDFLQQIRINASVKVVTIQELELADDFRALAGDVCPKGSPKHTIRDKFLGGGGNDDESNASSRSDAQMFGGLMSVNENTCLPNLIGADCNDNNVYNEIQESQQPYVPFASTTPQRPNYDVMSVEVATKFNSLIRQESPYASMVVTHLPLPHKASTSNDFMQYVDALVDNVDNMLLIQGTGVEYLTTVA